MGSWKDRAIPVGDSANENGHWRDRATVVDSGTPHAPNEDTRTIGEKLANIFSSHLYPKPEAEHTVSPEEFEKYKQGLPAALAGTAMMAAPIPGTTLGRIGLGAAGGGLIGALEPAGDMAERAKQAGKGALLGGAFTGAVEATAPLIGKASEWIGDKAKDFAEQKAFKALGPFKRQAAQNADEINQIGRTALDEGIIGWKPTSSQTIAERASEAVANKGGEIQALTDELSGLENQASYSGMPRTQIAENLKAKLIKNSEIPAVQERNAKVSQWIDDFVNSGEPNLSFQKLRQLKGDVKDLIKWDRLPQADIPLEEQFHRALYDELRSGEESGADAIEKAFYGNQSNRLQDLKSTYGDLKTAQRIAENRASSDTANRAIGLTDTISGGAGATVGAHVGGPVGAALGGAVGAVGNKLGRTYGNQVMAKAADATSKAFLSPTLLDLMKKSPAALPLLTKTLPGGGGALEAVSRQPAANEGKEAWDIHATVRENPAALGSYAPTLQNAASRGPTALSATHFVLQQTDPKYREKLNELQNSNEDIQP